MPVLSRGNIQTVTLPSSGAVVKLTTRITAGIAAKAAKAQEDEVAGFLGILAELIHEWDFTDEQGEPVEISEETLNYLDVADFTFLAELVGGEVKAQADSGQLSASTKKS